MESPFTAPQMPEEENNYFESEPFFDVSDIKEDYDRLDFGMKFNLIYAEDENEFDEHEQKKKFESCPYFV